MDGRRLLIQAEQGLGDIIQFARYAALAKRRGAEVTLACPAALHRLLRTCAGIDRLAEQGGALPACDAHVPLLSLPGIFGTRLDTIPADVPYLAAEPDLAQHWGQELSQLGPFRVGIVWQGNPKYRNDRHRSVPLARFAALAQVEGVRLVSLQRGPGSEQAAALAGPPRLFDPGSDRLDFANQAAILQHLDLLVTVDTAIAHLAGALGVAVWVALPYASDWRWLVGREDSPWYPTMRLFRQPRPGDWDSVFDRLSAALREEMRGQ